MSLRRSASATRSSNALRRWFRLVMGTSKIIGGVWCAGLIPGTVRWLDRAESLGADLDIESARRRPGVSGGGFDLYREIAQPSAGLRILVVGDLSGGRR